MAARLALKTRCVMTDIQKLRSEAHKLAARLSRKPALKPSEVQSALVTLLRMIEELAERADSMAKPVRS